MRRVEVPDSDGSATFRADFDMDQGSAVAQPEGGTCSCSPLPELTCSDCYIARC